MGTEKPLPGTSFSPPLVPIIVSWRQLWQVPVFVAGIMAVLAAWASRPLWHHPETRRLERKLAQVRRMLDDPRANVHDLKSLAENALEQIDSLPRRTGEAQFLLGRVYLRLAQQLPADTAVDAWKQARLHLELAEARGVPEEDRGRLPYYLGKALYQTGAEAQLVIKYLLPSVDEADDRSEAYAMLTQAFLQLRDYPSALDMTGRQLQLPATDENSLAAARLLRGQLLLEQLKQREEGRKVLARIGSGAPAHILSRALQLRAQSYQDEGAWAEAAKLWEQILAERRASPSANLSRILYQLGLCYRNLQRPADAANAWEQAAPLGDPESQAARLRLAQLWMETGKPAESMELYRGVFDAVRKARDYQNALVDLTQAQVLVKSGCENALASSQFSTARELADIYARLVPERPGELLLARVAEIWAKAQRENAKQIREAKRSLEEEGAARSHFREAGAAYTAAAEHSEGPQKAECLWQAAECYRLGGEMKQTITVLERYVQLQPRPERLSEAWYHLGRAHHALLDEAGAKAAYAECIGESSHRKPPDRFQYRARYQLALILINQRNLIEAEESLSQNLELMRTDPDPDAHEKSLYAYAYLLFARRDYARAAERWEQALRLYPTNPNAPSARYQLGTCYRRLADREIGNPSFSDLLAKDFSLHYRRQRALKLEQAAVNFEKLAHDLGARQKNASLTAAEEKLLRQALFALADCRFYLGDYPDAIRIYDNLASRYRRSVDGLLALQQLWYCQMMERPLDIEKSRNTLKGARILFDALDKKAFANRPETESRQAMERWLKQAEAQLKNLGS